VYNKNGEDVDTMVVILSKWEREEEMEDSRSAPLSTRYAHICNL
jgi:hypothetical protein